VINIKKVGVKRISLPANLLYQELECSCEGCWLPEGYGEREKEEAIEVRDNCPTYKVYRYLKIGAPCESERQELYARRSE